MTHEQMTLEHLLSRRLKASDSLENLVLAHRVCNENAGHLSIAEKVRIREQRLIDLLMNHAPQQRLRVLKELRIPVPTAKKNKSPPKPKKTHHPTAITQGAYLQS
jgi:hypothetical protein